MKIRNLFVLVVIMICAVLAAFILAGCEDDFMWHRPPWPPWPTEYSGIFSKFITDPADDLVLGVSGSPPYPVSYSPVDVTQASLGVQGHYFYIRIDYVGVIPTVPVDILEDPPVEAQTVGGHNTGFDMDVDNDGMIDVLYQVNFHYGRGIAVTAMYDFLPGTEISSILEGEFGEGGPGHNYVISV